MAAKKRAAKRKSATLPKTIYASVDHGGMPGEHLFVDAHVTPEECYDFNKTTTVGVYELVGTVKVTNTNKTTVE